MRRSSASASVSRAKIGDESLDPDSGAALRLEPWQEISGVVERLQRIEGGIELAIRGEGVLAIRGLGEREARRISSISMGTRLSILRTDLPHRPYVFRIHPSARDRATTGPHRSGSRRP